MKKNKSKLLIDLKYVLIQIPILKQFIAIFKNVISNKLLHNNRENLHDLKQRQYEINKKLKK